MIDGGDGQLEAQVPEDVFPTGGAHPQPALRLVHTEWRDQPWKRGGGKRW